ncbi:MAG: alpha-E domain-containing protein [Gammaproteobacteria bacterium]|nr:alpha-E domain-containing protein [Gammaproteobacteria bacterium]
MLSRVAENLYWMARYKERAENTARLINVNTNLVLDLPGNAHLGWKPIIDILGAAEQYYSDHDDAEERKVLRYLISDQHNSFSIIHSLSLARENCRTIRDIVPREVWESINDAYMYARQDAQRGVTRRGRHEFMQAIIARVQTITGMMAGTMLHDDGYQFLKMGRNLERADMTTRIIDVRSANLLDYSHEELTPFENIQWMSVLKSLTAYQMYRRTVQVRVSRREVLRFLLLEQRFPRSFYHTVSEVEGCLQQLPRNDMPLMQLAKVRKKVLSVRASRLKQEKLHQFIDQLQMGLARVHGAIDKSYFLHT